MKCIKHQLLSLEARTPHRHCRLPEKGVPALPSLKSLPDTLVAIHSNREAPGESLKDVSKQCLLELSNSF
jgi:hypothetical protein